MTRGREYHVSINGNPQFRVIDLVEFEKNHFMTLAECVAPSEDGKKLERIVSKYVADEKRPVLIYKDKFNQKREVTITHLGVIQNETIGHDTVRIVVLLSDDDVNFSDVTSRSTRV